MSGLCCMGIWSLPEARLPLDVAIYPYVSLPSHLHPPPSPTPPMQDVRVDSKVNKYVWSKGVHNVPFRVRIKLSRKRNEDEESASKMYTLVTLENVTGSSLKGLGTEIGDLEDE